MDMQALQCPFPPTHTLTHTLAVTVIAKYLRTLCVTMAIWRECSIEKGTWLSADHAERHATHMHTHTCTYTHRHTQTCIATRPLQDTKLSVFLCKVLRTLKNFYKCMHKSVPSIRTYVCVCVCQCSGYTNGSQKAAPK